MEATSGGGTFVVEMILNGETKRAKFKVKPTVTIESVKANLRSTFNVANGTLSSNIHDIDIVDELVAGDVYYFIEFTPLSVQDTKRRTDTPPTEADKQVFVLGMASDCGPNVQLDYNDLLGTCFAVTRKHVLTACRILLEADLVTSIFDVTSGLPLQRKFVISREGKKDGSKVTFSVPMEVRVVICNVSHDWALFELVDTSLAFPAWFPICSQSELPDLETESVNLKAYYAPIGQFQQMKITKLTIWVDEYRRILQYDKEDNSRIVMIGGLYRGSCGSPYVDSSGKVVALHLASSGIEGENVSLVTPRRVKRQRAATKNLDNGIEDDVIDRASVYASTCIGVVLANVPDLLDLVIAENTRR